MVDLKEYLELTHRVNWHPEQDNVSEELNKIKEYNKALIEKYPWLEPTNKWSGKKITKCANGEDGYWPKEPEAHPEYDYEYTELDELPDGWRLDFGDKICEEINNELIKYDYQNEYMIVQIKEKFGTLRWYDNGTPVGKLSDDYEEIITDSFKYPDYDMNTEYVEYVGHEGDAYTFHKHKLLEKCHIQDIIRKYEQRSEEVCINCGRPTKYETTGWVMFVCDECANKFDKKELIEWTPS